MTFRIFQVLQGDEVAEQDTVQLLPSGLTGTTGALRRLVHPDAGTFPALVYYSNPTRTFNFDSDVLRHPIASIVRTLSTSKTIRFEEVVEDVVITEQWEPGGGLSMPVFFFRQLYEYLVNPPEFDPALQTYIIWEPRDDSDDTFEVEVLGLQVGGGSPGKYNVKKYIGRGGPNDPQTPGTILTPTDTMDVSPTALLDQVVTLTMRIIRKVP